MDKIGGGHHASHNFVNGKIDGWCAGYRYFLGSVPNLPTTNLHEIRQGCVGWIGGGEGGGVSNDCMQCAARQTK